MSGASTESETAERRPETDVSMTLWQHLGELRNRILKAFIALFLCTIVAWTFHEKALNVLLIPYKTALADRNMTGATELQTLAPGDALVGYMYLSLVVGLVAASPIVFYQLWAFISPGLYKREKKLVFPFVFFSTTLFVSGVVFAYYFVFPAALSYMLSLTGKVGDSGISLVHRPTLEYYLDFSTRLLLMCGCVFELPLFISFLVVGGVVTPKQLLRFSRWAILLSFVVGAFVTPGPDVAFQLFVSLPLIALYFISLGIAYLLAPKRLET